MSVYEFMKGFGGHSYDALKGSLAPIGARRHLPARIFVKMVYDSLGNEIYEPNRWEFGVDFASGPRLNNDCGLSEAKVAKNLTWDLDQEAVKSISEQMSEGKYRIMAKQLESMVRLDDKDLEKIAKEFNNIEVVEKGNEEWQWKLK